MTTLKPKDIPDPDDATRIARMAIVDGRGQEIVHDVIDERYRARLITAFNHHEGLLALVKEYRRTIEYYRRVEAGNGDDEGDRLKAMNLALVDDAIAKAEGR